MNTVGRHVRALRQAHGWTLRDLAQRSELSTSFISQVERGLCSISISSLETICDVLGHTLASFFASTDDSPAARTRDAEVLMAQDCPVVSLSDGTISYRFLSRNFVGRKLEVVLAEIAPGYDYPPTSHDGEELGYVLEGRLRLVIGEETYRLGAGDSYHIAPRTPHGYTAETADGVKILWVGTLPGFRRRDGRPVGPAPD